MSRDIRERLSDPALVALLCPGRAWRRALLSARLIPDNWMGLVETPDGRRRLVPAREDPRPQRDDRLLLVRSGPLAVALQVAEQPAKCGNTVSATCVLVVRWEPNEDDLAALRRALLRRNELTRERLAGALAAAGARAGLQAFIRANPASRLVHEDRRDALFEALRAGLKRFVFDSGIVLERVARLEFSSPSLARQEARRRQAAERVERIRARELVEQAALAATRRRLDDLRGLLDKLRAAAEAHRDVQWQALLPALSPAERGRLLENLWRITPDRQTAAAIVVVAGNECVWLDPAGPERIGRRVALKDELGGLRSVTFCGESGLLVVGAARGLWAIDPDDGRVTGRYEVPDAGQPQTGFNAAAFAGPTLLATHSQLGCWSWRLDRPDRPRALLRPREGTPRTVRAATSAGQRVFFAADDCVHVCDRQGQPLSRLETGGNIVHCIAALDKAVYVGTANGLLLRDTLDGTQEVWEVLHRAPAAIETVQVRRWSDLVELVIPAGAQGVCGVYGDEGVVARLVQSATPIRRAWACDDLIVGLNEWRDRLIVMNANLPDRRGHNVPLARMLGHSIQDAAIVLKTEHHQPPGGAVADKTQRPAPRHA